MRVALCPTAIALCLLGHFGCTSTDEDALANSVELDHVYVYVPRKAKETAVVSALEAAGLNVRPQRNDFGDGVTGRYVLFENAYLELLWYDGVTSTDEDTRRRAEWEATGVSPFGVGMRRRSGIPDALPFPTRPFTAPWLKPGTQIRVLGGVNDAGPDFFVVPDSMAHQGTASHSLGIRRLTGAQLIVPSAGMTEAAQLVNASGLAEIKEGSKPALALSFDAAPRQRTLDLRPLLPVTLAY